MTYDLYVELGGESQGDVNALVNGQHRGYQIPSIAARIQLLAGIAARNEDVKEYVVIGDRKRGGGGYKSLVHMQGDPQNTPYARELITLALDQMKKLGLTKDTSNMTLLPPGSWFLQFTFTLAKPWISKDDDPFYVTESVNPVRKDKVFKVPVMAASSWKGLLRWTAMRIRLAKPVIPSEAKQSAEAFAKERFVQTLLFGDEQGEEPGQVKGFAKYVDSLNKAHQEYERLLRRYFGVKDDEPLPHHSGRLFFYPTFFDGIDVEVINPHSRKTRAGRQPIYLECVPIGATGAFSLLYVPFDLIGQPKAIIRQQAARDLQIVAEGLQAMFLNYGFSAKRTSGFGVAEANLEDGKLWMNIPDPSSTPSQPAPPAPREFDSFAKLHEMAETLSKEHGGAQ
ncbi:MAG: RAMP superfamily CRISPR-associated protein [Chloroflexota bacterium]